MISCLNISGVCGKPTQFKDFSIEKILSTVFSPWALIFFARAPLEWKGVESKQCRAWGWFPSGAGREEKPWRTLLCVLLITVCLHSPLLHFQGPHWMLQDLLKATWRCFFSILSLSLSVTVYKMQNKLNHFKCVVPTVNQVTVKG